MLNFRCVLYRKYPKYGGVKSISFKQVCIIKVMHHKQSFYELPDLTRSIDIIIGIILGYAIRFLWNIRSNILINLKKYFFYGSMVTWEGLLISVWLSGFEYPNHLLLWQIGLILMIFQHDRTLNYIFRNIRSKQFKKQEEK